ncbi:hypothetical protein [Stygiolobus caldivivus]|uniref:Uncharacterized protein n=1 Tax=Stygiolobus caldivivus TaxID=2824673 RepID=A0A8D5U704_9CREN|nr:hypothetical protein [Stygiolobus caldivivus]BCU69996.1 hypothetical protein KN1_12930 [Stygiolobus caldivivus]
MISKDKVLDVIEFFRANRSVNEIRGVDKRVMKLLIDLGVLKVRGRVISLDTNFRAIHTLVEVVDNGKRPKIRVRSIIFDKLKDNDKIFVVWKSYLTDPIPVVERGEFEIKQTNPLPILAVYTTTTVQFVNPVIKFRFSTGYEHEILFNLMNLPYHYILPPSGKPFKKFIEVENIDAPKTLYFYYNTNPRSNSPV